MKWLTKVYKALLWFCGFEEGETISKMLARQKGRLGGWWWVLVSLTFLALVGVILFLVWLTRHIATLKLKKS